MDVLLGVLFKSNQKQCHFLKARRVWKDNPGICVCVCVCTHKYMCMLTYFYTYVLRACSMLVWSWIWVEWGFPGGCSGKEPACQFRRLRDKGSIPGSGRSPGEGHGNPLQYSCLENPMDRGSWWAAVHGVVKNRT